MSSLHRRASKTRHRTLHLGEHGAEGIPAPPANMPVSPTDSILSPCSKKLGNARKSSHSNLLESLAKSKSRWETGPRQVEDSESECDDGEVLPCEDSQGSGSLGTPGRSRSFFNDITYLVVPEVPAPTSLPLVLGTRSSHRRMVMDKLGWEHSCASADIDEKAIRHEDTLKMVVAIAEAKAAALMDQAPKPSILITADQVCEFEGKVREKPEGIEEAREFLSSYSNNHVFTVSGMVVTNTETGKKASGTHTASVCWGEIESDAIERVITRGVVMSCAGGFAIEDPDLKTLVMSVEGGVDSVYGLPIDLMIKLIKEVVKEEDGNGNALPGAASEEANAA